MTEVSQVKLDLVLLSEDNVELQVSSDFVQFSTTIENLVNDISQSNSEAIPVGVSSEILKHIQALMPFYEKKTKDKPKEEKSVEEKVEEKESEERMKYLGTLTQENLFSLIIACNYLDIKCILTTCCRFVANMIHGKNPEEIRKLFNIKNDFTPEEEEQIKKENEWATDR